MPTKTIVQEIGQDLTQPANISNFKFNIRKPLNKNEKIKILLIGRFSASAKTNLPLILNLAILMLFDDISKETTSDPTAKNLEESSPKPQPISNIFLSLPS